MVAYAAFAERLSDELAAGREAQLLQVHLPFLDIWVYGNEVALCRLVKGLQLVVVADGLQAVAGEDDCVAAGYVDALVAAQDAADVDPVARRDAQLAERLSCPARVLGDVDVGDVDVAVDELVLKQRAALPGDLCGDVARVQVLYEPPLQPDGTVLQLA